MMNVNDLLAQMGGLGSLSKELGLSEEQAASGAAVLRRMLPMLAAGYMVRQRGTNEAAPSAGSRDTSRGAAGGLADLLGAGSGNGNPLEEILRMAGKNLKK